MTWTSFELTHSVVRKGYVDYEQCVFVPENPSRDRKSLKLCKLGKETRRQWGVTVFRTRVSRSRSLSSLPAR